MGTRIVPYVELTYVEDGKEKSGEVFDENKRDVKLLTYKNNILYARYYNRTVFTINGVPNLGNITDSSCKYYNGDRMTPEKFINKYRGFENFQNIANQVIESKAPEIIVTNISGKLYVSVPNENDMTIQEYLKSAKKNSGKSKSLQ